MKKFLIIIAVVVVVAGALVLFMSSSMLGRAVKAGIETYGPRLTGTPVTLASASVSPWDGEGSLSGLSVANPEGYSDASAIHMGEIALDVEPTSIAGDAIHIERIYVSKPEFNYERTLQGGNLDTILQNIQQATASKEAQPQKAEGEPLKLIIDSVVIEDGNVSLSAAGFETELPLPRVELKDIGKEQGGVTADQAAMEIMQALLGQVIQVGVDAVASGQISLGNAQADELLKTGKKVDEARSVLKGLLGGDKEQKQE